MSSIQLHQCGCGRAHHKASAPCVAGAIDMHCHVFAPVANQKAASHSAFAAEQQRFVEEMGVASVEHNRDVMIQAGSLTRQTERCREAEDIAQITCPLAVDDFRVNVRGLRVCARRIGGVGWNRDLVVQCKVRTTPGNPSCALSHHPAPTETIWINTNEIPYPF